MKRSWMMISRKESAVSSTFQCFLIASMVVVLAGLGVPAAFAEKASPNRWGNQWDRQVPAEFDNEEEIPFDEAEIYFELNNTDGDLGIHSLIDGEPWKRLEIEDPRGRKMLNIFVQGRLRRQGLTEIFFESAEPGFDELPPSRFFRRFPEGEYEIAGKALDGMEMESIAELTHLLPAPPANIVVNGKAVPEDCEEDPGPVVSTPVLVSWDPVTHSHPELGITNAPIEVVLYQVVVEQLDLEAKISMDLPTDVTDVELPEAFTDLGGDFKIEILVREESGNQTAVESCFSVE
jgi:hypothetical protein